MKKINILIFLITCLVLGSINVLGATVITTPSNEADLTIGSSYSLTGTTAITGAFNCTWYEKHKGETSYSELLDLSAATGGNETDGSVTIPNDFGTHIVNLTCINSSAIETVATTESITFGNYAAGETAEITIDMIVKVGAAFVGFGALIGIFLLYIWIRKKGINF